MKVQRHLEKQRELQIDATTTLQDVLNRSRNAQAELVKAALRKNKDFETAATDDCIVLQQGNNFWCFLESAGLELLSDKIVVSKNDFVWTRPLTEVFPTKPSGKQELIRVPYFDLISKVQGVKELEYSAKRKMTRLFDRNPKVWSDRSPNFDLVIISRRKASGMFHLVIPRYKDRDKFNVIVNHDFGDGDIVEFTNAVIFLQRFR